MRHYTCANKVFLQNGEGKTIEYASQHFKSQEILETRVSHSHNSTQGGPASQGFSINRQKVMRPVVHEGSLKSLPRPKLGKMGLSGYCDTAAVGTDSPYRMDLSTEFLDKELPQPDNNEPGFCPRTPDNFKLQDWDIQDLNRLGLGQFPQLLENRMPPATPGPNPKDSEDGDDPDIFKIAKCVSGKE